MRIGNCEGWSLAEQVHEHGCHTAIGKGEFIAFYLSFLALIEGLDRLLNPEGTDLAPGDNILT
jgi:hypothetical protein